MTIAVDGFHERPDVRLLAGIAKSQSRELSSVARKPLRVLAVS